MFKLRPYQTEAFIASKDALNRGVNNQLICWATGCGKSLVFALGKQFHQINKRQMVLVHREELASQALDKIKRANPTLSIGLEMADSYASDRDDIVVASVQTLSRGDNKRLQRFKRDEFGLVTPDEAHHYVSDTFKAVINHFGCQESDSKTLCLALTATPNRTDNQGLGQIFDEIVHQYTILDGINDGYLSNLRGIKVSTDVNLDSVRISDNVGNDSVLSAVINTPARNKKIVHAWKEVAKQDIGYRQTIAFCADVTHAKDLAEEFNKAGIKAAAVYSGMKDRAMVLEAHRKGLIKVLTNFGILTEGYDDWHVSCIIMARPTKSQLLFTQMVGRGTRIPDGVECLLSHYLQAAALGKTDCIVLDVVDSTSRHSLVTLASLFGLAPKADLDGKTITEALKIVDEVKEKRPEIVLDKLDNINQLTTQDVDLFEDRTPPEVEQNTKLKWTKVEENKYRILLPLGESVSVYKDLIDKWEVKGRVAGTAIWQPGLQDLSEAFRVADNFISVFGKGLLQFLRQKQEPRRSKPQSLVPLASDKQKIYLSSLYKDNPKVMGLITNNKLTTKEASNLIANFRSKK